MKKLFLMLLAAICIQASADDLTRPNILFLVADDLGYSDIGCYGSEIHTPTLDSLAAGGLRFTEFYNTSRCWSSRSCLLTGYYAQEIRRDALTGIDFPAEPKFKAGAAGVRPRWAVLLPELLKPLGYHSYLSGKWHVDGKPAANGFEHDYLNMNADGYFAQVGVTEDGVKLPDIKPGTNYYNTIAVADYAIKYLKAHAARHPGEPFFEYVAFHSPHFPVQALPADIAIYQDRYQSGWDVMREERFSRMKRMGIINCDLSPLDPVAVPGWNLTEAELHERIGPQEVGHAVPWNTLTRAQQKFQSEKMSVHAAMVHRMDLEIGRVVQQVKAMGVFDNTLIVFVSDNGASAEQIIRGLGEDPAAPVGSAYSYLGIGPGWASFCNTPLRLYKSWEEEGGISTPLIVHWPAGIKAHNELRSNPGHLIDLVPTVLDIVGAKPPARIAGLPVPPLPGKSLVPVFTKDGSVQHDYLWFNHIGNRAILVGDWKLVGDQAGPWELFNLKNDRSETRNLANQYPDKVKELNAAWIQHAKEFHALALQDLPATVGGGKKKGNPNQTESGF
jgi:arylsulfatase